MSVEITGNGGITVKMIAYSTHPSKAGCPLITLQLRYPRFIHAEFMTHRVFSRNASSSRAIPVAKMLEQVRDNPAMPVHWGKNQPGMQAHAELEGEAFYNTRSAWRQAAAAAADLAAKMDACGAHKQIANRILEPFQFIGVIVTATEWMNFFELRDHPDAQPEIRELARVMKAVIQQSRPTPLGYGDWHLPYVSESEYRKVGTTVARKLSAARCARVSYLTHDGQTPSVEKDLALFERLVGSEPLHASPIEHQGTPLDPNDLYGRASLCGNFRQWVQFRQVFQQGSVHPVAHSQE